jgi:hypothetical protein
VVLNDGAFPELLIKPAIWYQRISIRTSAYFNFLTDRMPLSEASPVSLEIRVPARISRLTAFLRLFMLVPHIIVLMLLGLAMSVTTFIAWWAILITGKYPRGLFDFAVGVSRWNTRVGVYAALLTDTYPSFGLSD